MYLPISAPADAYRGVDTADPFRGSGGNGAPPGGWSSLIGIITAICGNILISFALNTQRYAHMRLSRDREQWREKQEASRKRRSKSNRQRAYGTQQSDIAEERARENAKAEPSDGEGYTLEDPEESNEADPLIPHIDARKASVDSDETARPNEKEDEQPRDKSYLKSPIWWLGIGLMTVGEAGNFLAYGFAPASIVSPLGVVALVSNCLIAPLLLGERFRWRDGLGVLIAVAGCVTVVLSANDSNPKLTADKIWKLISQWEFETYFGITCFLIVVLMVASNKYGDRTVLIDLGLVALFGGYTALSTKGIASLLSNTIWHVVTFPITYLLLAVLIITAVMQIRYVNKALQHFSATVVIPTQFVLFTISVIVGSAVLYRDFERVQPGDAVKFFGGCALTFLGVWCITSGRSDDSDDDHDLGDEEDAIDLVDEEHTRPEIRERDDSRRWSVTAGSSQATPQLERLRTRDSGIPSVIVTPQMTPSFEPRTPSHDPSRLGLDDVSPANAAAIHSKSMTELPQEGEAAKDPKKPPQLHATTSAPVVPRALTPESSPLRPRTPLNRNKTGPLIDSPSRRSPATPAGGRRQSQGQLLDPQSSNRLLSRQSIVGLLPGPIMSPLSTSLSAIVADSLRRGVDNPTSTLKRRTSKRPATGADGSRRMSTAALKRHSIASGELDLDAEEAEQLRAGAGSPQGRVRSLSATLGDLFGSVKRQRLESRESIQEVPQSEERQ